MFSTKYYLTLRAIEDKEAYDFEEISNTLSILELFALIADNARRRIEVYITIDLLKDGKPYNSYTLRD